MGKHAIVRIFLLAIITLCILSPVQAGTRHIASTDRLPLGDWTYDAMMSLAADGIVPGMSARVFEGDRRFNRMEMAEVIASVLRSTESTHLSSGQRALLNHLVSEFRPELMEIAPETAGQWSGESIGYEASLLGYYRDLSLEEDTAPDASYRASGFLSLPGSAFGIFTMAEHEERFYYDPRTGPQLDKAFIGGSTGKLSWLVGRAYANWGPAYSGSLIMSDNAPAFWQARAGTDLDFGKLIGRVKVTQFASTFEDVDQALYLVGRRYEKRLSDRWHFGVSETAKMNISPNPLILVMPLYLYQHLFAEENEEINNLMGLDLTYSTRNGTEIYGELVVDDITSPKLFGTSNERPRKIGYTLGLSIPRAFGGKRYSALTAEYTLIDPLTYGATRPEVPELAYLHDSQLIGNPTGPNAKIIYLRGEYSISDRVDLIGEYVDQRQKDPGPPERGSGRFLSLMAAYDIAPDKSVAFRIAPHRIRLPDSSIDDDTQYELRASFAF
jgi:hypothetical protein